MTLHRQGQLAEAAISYQKVLAIDPLQFDALHLLGVLEAQRGRRHNAELLLGQAIEIDPRSAEAHANLARIQHEAQNHHEALASCDKALSINPRFALAWNTRACALNALKRFDQALMDYDRAIALEPNYAEAVFNRGNTLLAMERFDEALKHYDRALTIAPKLTKAWVARGIVLLQTRRFEEALTSYSRALTIDPKNIDALHGCGNALRFLKRHEDALKNFENELSVNPDSALAHNSRGATLVDLGRIDEALDSFARAISLKPDLAEAFANRGVALANLGRFQAALADYDQAIALEPNRAEVFYNRGYALFGLNRLEEAIASYDRAIALRPDYADAFCNRGTVLLSLKRCDDAVASYALALALDPDMKYLKGAHLHAKMHDCDWSGFETECAQITSALECGFAAVSPLHLLAFSSNAKDQLHCARNYISDRCAGSFAPLWRGERYSHPRIRLAYMSADYREHPVSFLTAGMFERHDRTRFETIAISLREHQQSEMRTRLQTSFDRFVNVETMSDHEVAKLLRSLEIDIAIDLNGFTDGLRPNVFARRPAPIHVNYLGYPGTMGAEFMDYILADKIIIPLDQKHYYGEKVVYLPDCFQINDDKRPISDAIPSRRELGLPENGFVFCCLNNTYKLTPFMFEIWIRLLQKVDGSVLWLLGQSSTSQHNLQCQAVAGGIAASRVVFAPRIRYADYLIRYQVADLFLDTLPFNGGTTISDALWASLPVVTCSGDSFASRMGASLLSAIGLPELIASSLEDYEALALKIARDPALLDSLKRKLARNRETQPLFNTERFTRYVETAYAIMWERYQSGEPPQSFDVHPAPPAL
jgi:protein O-GlcNAc transferase